MCGIAGVLYKQAGSHEIGKTLIDMLDGCQHRGPDSTGFALYGDKKDLLQLRFIVPTDEAARKKAIENIATFTAEHPVGLGQVGIAEHFTGGRGPAID